MNKKITLIKSNTPMPTRSGYSKMIKTLGSIAMLLLIFAAGCRKDEFEGEVVGLCPTVISDPMDKAVDVVLDKVIAITFNTDMDSTTINNQTFIIKQGTNVVAGKIAATADAKVYTFTPTVPLAPFTVYSGLVTNGAKDKFRTAMVDNYNWSFTTIPLIAVSSNPILGGTTIGAGVFAQGSLATVAATPNAGYVFVNWTEAGTQVSTSSTYAFTTAGNRTLVANFAAIIPGQFAVVLLSNPIIGGENIGSGAYASGALVTVASTPNPGFTFINWTEGANIVSTSSSYQFTITGNRALVANYSIVPASQFALTLSSSPLAGGTTIGAGSYVAATSVQITATARPGFTFVDWTENGVRLSTSAAYTLVLNANRSLVANFVADAYTLTVVSDNGVVVKNPNQATYNYNTSVQLTATANPGFTFLNWTEGTTTFTTNPLTVVMTSNRNIKANYTQNAAAGPIAIDLGSAADFATLTKSGISTTGITLVTGNIGVSPAAATAITGFGLIMDTDGTSSHTPIVTGKVYASDYAAPTPAKMTTAISDMETAFTTANGLTTPAPITGISGNISGTTLAPGLYKWSTSVLVTSAGVTLNGGPNDVWVFQIAQDLIVENSAIISLAGGAQAKNIFWVVTGQANLGTNSDFSGIILSKTLISLNTGAKVKGRLFAQTAVTLNASTVTQP